MLHCCKWEAKKKKKSDKKDKKPKGDKKKKPRKPSKSNSSSKSETDEDRRLRKRSENKRKKRMMHSRKTSVREIRLFRVGWKSPCQHPEMQNSRLILLGAKSIKLNLNMCSFFGCPTLELKSSAS